MASSYSCPYQYAVLIPPISCAGSQSESLGDSWDSEAHQQSKVSAGGRSINHRPRIALQGKVKVFLKVLGEKVKVLVTVRHISKVKFTQGGVGSIKHGSRSALRGCTGELWCVYCPVSKVMGESGGVTGTLCWNSMECARLGEETRRGALWSGAV